MNSVRKSPESEFWRVQHDINVFCGQNLVAVSDDGIKIAKKGFYHFVSYRNGFNKDEFCKCIIDQVTGNDLNRRKDFCTELVGSFALIADDIETYNERSNFFLHSLSVRRIRIWSFFLAAVVSATIAFSAHQADYGSAYHAFKWPFCGIAIYCAAKIACKVWNKKFLVQVLSLVFCLAILSIIGICNIGKAEDSTSAVMQGI